MNKKVLLLVAIVFIGLLLSLFLLNKHQKDFLRFHSVSDKITMIPQDIRYYDEVLTMSAYMAVFTHDLKWIERYDNAVPPLEKRLLQARGIFPEIIVHLDELEAEVETLISLERQSFELLRQARFEEAQSLLFSEKYDLSKKEYNKHLESIIQTLEVSIENFEDDAQEKFEYLVSIIIFVIALILVLGVWLIAVFRKQTKAILDSRESLENQHMLLQKIINLVPVAMFWKDMDGVYLGANQAFMDDAQLNDVSQLIGKTDFDMTWKRDAEQFREDDAAVAKSGVPRLLYEEEQPKEDGSCIYLVTSKVPLRDVHDNIIGILGVYNDMTEQKMLAKDTKEKEEKLFKQARHAQMGEMIAMIAHQWRQPLSSISAIVSTLQIKRSLGTYSDECLEEELNKIASSTQHLSKTIDDFRGFFKEEKTRLSTTLEKITNESLEIINPTLKSSNISILTDYQCNEKLLTYSNELKQVFISLLKNAQEVLDDNEVKEKIIEIKTYKDKDKYYLEVYDNAGGIEEAIMDKIFEPYFTTKGALNGTGLGLYMSKMIIDEHLGGKITAVNRDDGVSFIIELSKVQA